MKTALCVFAGVLLFCVVAYVSAGCGGRQDLERGLEASRDVATYAAACAAGAKEVDDAKCAGDPACLEAVKTKYAPLADAFDAFHAFWCGVSPESEGC